MRFAAIGLDHRHIYDLVGGLRDAGAACRLLAADHRPAGARRHAQALATAGTYGAEHAVRGSLGN